jgi:phosphoglycolate phosphatase-like HAD superfamily hydrolase
MNTTINRAVFLDFDGVLFDTVREAYAVSMISLDRSNRTSDIDFGSKHFEKFNQLRYLVGPAWNYYYVMKAVEEGPSTDDLEIDYKSLLDQQTQGEHCSFEKKFFQTRQQLREKEHDHWLSMIFPYNIVEDLRIIMRKFKEHFFLVTTRDRESVKDLMDLHNMDILDSNIFAKTEYESYRSKKHIIKSLIDKYQIEEALFIDDLEEHLESCGTIEGLSTIQAKWGYVVPAKKEDNSVVLLKELERFIHGENVRA